MTTPPHRPLTPLEIALLRAVVQLGEQANSLAIHKAIEIAGFVGDYSTMCDYLACLRDLGLLSCRDVIYSPGGPVGRAGRCLWRPACDLTAVLP